MRATLTSPIAMLVALWAAGILPTSCTTPGSSKNSETVDYDGAADSMDSLPDCIPELEGSSFWVRDKKGAYDCMANGQWKNRKSGKKPDDDESDVPGAWTPRMIDK